MGLGLGCGGSKAGGLYAGMIAPFLDFPIRGAVNGRNEINYENICDYGRLRFRFRVRVRV